MSPRSSQDGVRPAQPLALDFLVIGAQKCATSWMFLCLADHPDIQLPVRKKERTYIGGSWFDDHGPDAFLDRFHPAIGDATATGDVSVDYMYDRRALAAILKHVGRPRVVALLRDPVDRMISGYHWMYRKGAFDRDSTVSATLGQLLDAEGRFRFGPGVDPMGLVGRGLYADQLRPFIDALGVDRVLVVGHGEVRADPLRAIQRVYRFLGVDDTFVPPSLTSKPKVNANIRSLHILERLMRGLAPAMRVLDRINQRFARIAPPVDIEPEIRARLERAFKPSLQDLDSLLERLPEESRPGAL